MEKASVNLSFSGDMVIAEVFIMGRCVSYVKADYSDLHVNILAPVKKQLEDLVAEIRGAEESVEKLINSIAPMPSLTGEAENDQ